MLTDFLLEGWERIQTLLEPDALAIYRELTFRPEPLLAALRKYPFTLVHGDYHTGWDNGGNVALLPGPPPQACAFDWELASYGLMTVDLAWFVNRSPTVRRSLSLDQAAAYYRRRLEHYLGFGFDDDAWQAMVALGFFIDTLRSGLLSAYFIHHGDEANQPLLRAELDAYHDQIRAGARWL